MLAAIGYGVWATVTTVLAALGAKHLGASADVIALVMLGTAGAFVYVGNLLWPGDPNDPRYGAGGFAPYDDF